MVGMLLGPPQAGLDWEPVGNRWDAVRGGTGGGSVWSNRRVQLVVQQKGWGVCGAWGRHPGCSQPLVPQPIAVRAAAMLQKH
jgi:hypothetical protein